MWLRPSQNNHPQCVSVSTRNFELFEININGGSTFSGIVTSAPASKRKETISVLPMRIDLSNRVCFVDFSLKLTNFLSKAPFCELNFQNKRRFDY